MSDKRDYYEVLGVSKDADDKELKKPSGLLQESTTQTRMMHQMQMKNSKKSKRHMLFFRIQRSVATMTDSVTILLVAHRLAQVDSKGSILILMTY